MLSLFRKKQAVRAFAEVLEDGRASANRELKKAKYREYRGAEPMLSIAVRVQPQNEPPFEATMKAGVSKSLLLMPGVRVQVTYDPQGKDDVVLDDELQAILDRNSQLVKKA